MTPPPNSVQSFCGQTADQLTVDHGRRRTSAEAEAKGWLKGDVSIGGGLAPIETEAPLGALCKRIGAHCLAGFGPAQLNGMLTALLQVKIVVKRSHAVNFGARHIQSFRNEGKRFLRQIAEFFLESVKDRHSRPFLISHGGNNATRRFLD